jgi:hypothetical protein
LELPLCHRGCAVFLSNHCLNLPVFPAQIVFV